MHKSTLIRSFVVVTIILSVSLVHAQESEASPIEFDPVKYEMTIRALLEKANDLGAHRGKIGLDFVDQYNAVVKQFPDKIQQVEMISRSVADEYGLTYEIERGIITTARFASTGSKTVEPSSPNENTNAVPEEIFKIVEQMPRFPGCEDLVGSNDEKFECSQKLLLEYIYSNLQYPDEAKSAVIEGRVVVQFVVEENGEITDVNAVRDIGNGCGAEAERVVNLMNSMNDNWIPGKQRGRPVRVQFTLPIQFKL